MEYNAEEYAKKLYKKLLYINEHATGSIAHDAGMHCSYIHNYLHTLDLLREGRYCPRYENMELIGEWTEESLLEKIREKASRASKWMDMRAKILMGYKEQMR